jgi:hypothetical protein
VTKRRPERRRKPWQLARLAALPLAGAALIWALGTLPAPAQDEDLIVTHAVATFSLDDLTYPADFEHLSYVNPDAPKGGEMSLSWSSAGGSFDSLHPYTNQGNPAVLSSIFFESMLEARSTRSGNPIACCARRWPTPRISPTSSSPCARRRRFPTALR